LREKERWKNEVREIGRGEDYVVVKETTKLPPYHVKLPNYPCHISSGTKGCI
jgi:hypothetical protein